MTIQIRSYAKINLKLKVGPVGSDGYHPIETVFQTLTLHDTIELTPIADSGWHLECNRPDVPLDERNLIIQALHRFRDQTKITTGYCIHLDKRIPVAAGLGGGSSNAAATLITLNKMHNNPLTDVQMHSIALGIGSDVPFFLMGGTATATGRGEKLREIGDSPQRELLLVKPPFGISAKEAYMEYEKLRSMGHNFTTDNDLEPGVFDRYEDLATIRNILQESGADTVIMCGSGSTMCGIFVDETSANNGQIMFSTLEVETIRCRFLNRNSYEIGFQPEQTGQKQ